MADGARQNYAPSPSQRLAASGPSLSQGEREKIGQIDQVKCANINDFRYYMRAISVAIRGGFERMTVIDSAAGVLAYWFAEGMAERWFKKDPAFDREIGDRLGPLYRRAAAGELDDWPASAEGALALVLLLDQVPRNLFRDDPRAFATDAKAVSVTKAAVERGLDSGLKQIERVFLYLPLEHCEDLADQETCVRLTGQLDENADWCTYAIQHRDIIARFGRFPHRNAVLGRETTAEEAEFLKKPDSSF